jgi:hypothetical protein
MKPKIVSKMKHDSGVYELVILSETKSDGKVKYYYTMSACKKIEEIMVKRMLTYEDWHFIQRHGRLTHKDILPPDEEN